ncbi:MAG: hypothetical protein GX620_01645 [Chloroflexi bacterium]|nr:hypothetical protein [Chloroflexota bacterium]
MLGPELVGSIIGGVLTLMVLSYLLGDNPLYRAAMHLFVGLATGYALGFAVKEVLVDRVAPSLSAGDFSMAVPVVLGLLLTVKVLTRHSPVGGIALAFLVGTGTAVALGGALIGTLIPQIEATGAAFVPESRDLLGVGRSACVVVGTVCALMAFNFTGITARGGLLGVWRRLLTIIAGAGRLFLVVGFGVAYAGALVTALTMFVGRVDALVEMVVRIVNLFGF